MKKSVRQTQKITNMAGERILYRIERDLGLTLLVLILGLAFSYRGTRGLPVPWLGPDGANVEFFILSIFIIFWSVFFIDLLAAAVILVREPSADRQTAETSVIVNSVDYAEYEDYEDEDDYYVNEHELNYEYVDGVKKQSSMAGVVITVACLIIAMIGGGLSALNDSDDYEDWDTGNVVADDDYATVNYDSMFYLAYDAIYNLGQDDFEYMQSYIVNGISQAEFDALIATHIDWSNTWFEEELGRSYNNDETRATIVYRLNNDEGSYLAAFNFSGEELDRSELDDEDIECILQGFTVFPDAIMEEYGYDFDAVLLLP